ncbi:hypothetical protein VKT23_000023 [Stygiomarasmius scandens]|uniref:Taste receptor type 2 n=1 Tax=Marasmiellus scandens TaxID=2682957 RepID=A0ABR1K4U9_9AGAR
MSQYPPSTQSDDLLQHIRTLGVEMAVIFLLYGLYAAFSLIAMYCLLLRGIRNSKPRTTLFIITFLEFIITTSYLALRFVFFLIIIPKSTQSVINAGPGYFERIETLASRFRIATEFLLRLNFVFSDGIVIWRTWSLFPYKTPIKVLLSLCLLGSSACIFVDAGMYAQKVLRGGFDAVDDPRQTMIVILPLLITNLVATTLVGYMAWNHRKDIQRNLKASAKMSSRIQKILLLLLESGLIYCGIWISNIFVIIFSKNISAPSLGIYSDAMPFIAALYPVLIIMLTTLEDYKSGPENEMVVSRSIKFASGRETTDTRQSLPEDIQMETSVSIPDHFTGANHRSLDS